MASMQYDFGLGDLLSNDFAMVLCFAHRLEENLRIEVFDNF